MNRSKLNLKQEFGDRIHCLGPIVGDAAPRGLAGRQVMIAVFGPVETEGPRELVALDLGPGAEGIPGPLHDQARGLDRLEVCRPQPLRLAGWMEGIAEADQAGGGDFVGKQARHAAAHRFAADSQAAGLQSVASLAPGVQQLRLPIRGPLPAVGPPRRHVGELEAGDAQAPVAQTFGKGRHEGTVHRRAGAVRQNQRPGSFSRAVEEKAHVRHDDDIFVRSNIKGKRKLTALGADYSLSRLRLWKRCCATWRSQHEGNIEESAVRPSRIFALSLAVVLALAGCGGDPGVSGQRWRAHRDGDLPSAPLPPAAERQPSPAEAPPEIFALEPEIEAAPTEPGPAVVPPHVHRRQAFLAALPERRSRHDQVLWARLTAYDDARRRSEALAALLAAESDQEVVTALDWTMSRIYAGKGSSAYLAAYALLHQRAGMVEGAIVGDLLARLRIAEDASRCASAQAAQDKLLLIRQLLLPLATPLDDLEPAHREALAAHVLAENVTLPRNHEDAWLCRGGTEYAAKYVEKHRDPRAIQALRIQTMDQTMVLLPDDPEIETGGFRTDSAWEASIDGLRAAFRRKYGLAE